MLSVRVCMRTYVFGCMCVRACVRVRVYLHTHPHEHIHTPASTHTHERVPTNTQSRKQSKGGWSLPTEVGGLTLHHCVFYYYHTSHTHAHTEFASYFLISVTGTE